MKNLLAATVIFLSSCTAAYADYGTTKACANIGNYVSAVKAEISTGRTTIEQQVALIKEGGSPGIGTDIMLAGLSEAHRDLYTTRHDWYMSSAETCLKLIRLSQTWGDDSRQVKDAVGEYLLYRGW
jgi:hypothetical protein